MQNAGWLIYQPLLVGLGAVVLASIGNTLVEWCRQSWQHERRARVLRTAFAEELRAQRRYFDNAMSKEQREETTGSFLIPTDNFTPALDHMIGDIGFLRPREVASIIKAYSQILLAPKNLALLGTRHKDEYSGWIEVPVQYRDVLISMNEGIVEAIDEALAILEPEPALDYL